MSKRTVSPEVQLLLDEAYSLPDCAARDAALERAARAAEALGDLDSAWSARCSVLGSSSSHSAPRFDTLFMCLAWCLAVSDRDPERFNPSSVLWQCKWVATAAPGYASVPRGVLDRIIDDIEVRFSRASWGRRAALHKRFELFALVGELDRAREIVPEWLASQRDRGSDCPACEIGSVVWLHSSLRDDETAVRHARPIMQGRLSCATVPHSTFGTLLLPLDRLGRRAEARRLYDRGRRLVAALQDGVCRFAAPYLYYAARIGEYDDVVAQVRSGLRHSLSLRSDLDRLEWYGAVGAALEVLARNGIERIDVPVVAGISDDGWLSPAAYSRHCLRIAEAHAAALDRRNKNDYYTRLCRAMIEESRQAPDA